MISRSVIDEIKSLFIKKDYELALKVAKEKSQIEQRPAGLSNLLGLCKILKLNKDENDILSSMLDFEDAYLKEKNTIHGLDSLCNMISISTTYINSIKKLSEKIFIAEQYFTEALKNFNDNEKLLLNGVELYKYFVDVPKIKEILEKLIHINPKNISVIARYAFVNNYTSHWKQENFFNHSKKYENYFFINKVKPISEIDFKKNDKIRIGLVSRDFSKYHSVTFFVKKLLKYLDKNKFETYVFSFSDQVDESSNEIKDSSEKWFNFNKLSNQEVIEKIQKERIEVLIDIGGLTSSKRIEIFKSRVSPVQVSWLAYCNTIGFKNIDYLIADNNLIKSEENHYSEKIIKLKEIWNAHSGFDFKRDFSDTPAKKNNYITYGSFNNFLKISDETVYVWSEILKKSQNSKLILKSSNNSFPKRIIDIFKKNGVLNSIEFYNRVDYPSINEHLNLYRKIDIALDTFPFNGVTTSFEALWCGIPVLTMSGYNFNSRCGSSILKNANLDQLISKKPEDYIVKALELSNNIDKLSILRRDIFDRILNTPLFDTKKFASNFGSSLLEIYKR